MDFAVSERKPVPLRAIGHNAQTRSRLNLYGPDLADLDCGARVSIGFDPLVPMRLLPTDGNHEDHCQHSQSCESPSPWTKPGTLRNSIARELRLNRLPDRIGSLHLRKVIENLL